MFFDETSNLFLLRRVPSSVDICLAWLKSPMRKRLCTVAGINSTLRGEPAPVASADPALSALSAFAQQITAAPASASAAQGRDSQFDDKTYAALRDFAQGIGAPQPESLMDWPKMAAADNALDALREFLNKGSSSQPPRQQPKSRQGMVPLPGANNPALLSTPLMSE